MLSGVEGSRKPLGENNKLVKSQHGDCLSAARPPLRAARSWSER